jgi:hypothetical protein
MISSRNRESCGSRSRWPRFGNSARGQPRHRELRQAYASESRAMNSTADSNPRPQGLTRLLGEPPEGALAYRGFGCGQRLRLQTPLHLLADVELVLDVFQRAALEELFTRSGGTLNAAHDAPWLMLPRGIRRLPLALAPTRSSNTGFSGERRCLPSRGRQLQPVIDDASIHNHFVASIILSRLLPRLNCGESLQGQSRPEVLASRGLALARLDADPGST